MQFVRYQQTERLNNLIEKAGIEAMYILTSGQAQTRFKKLVVPLWVHAVFPAKISDIHGDRYACISDWLTRESFNNKVPFVPHIVDILTNEEARNPWREKHGIGAKGIVIGSMGGSQTFDLGIAKEGLKRALENKKELYFVALNHKPFLNHERALFLPGTDDLNAKSAFISGCDAMLHGRTQGETFGLACAEFTAAGKPVLAWRHAPERHHLQHFCPPSLHYSTAAELKAKLQDFDPDEWDSTALQQRCNAFRPEVIAPQFERVFARNPAAATAPPFNPVDRTMIFKRRLQRSLRSRLSKSQQQGCDLRQIAIDPTSGFPIEE
jgi:hypothetical protein